MSKELREALEYCKKEYTQNYKEPIYIKLNNTNYIVPHEYSINSNATQAKIAFIKDIITSSNSKEVSRYNKAGVKPLSITIKDDDIQYIHVVPFANHLTDTKKSDIKSKLYNRTQKKYIKAVNLTKRHNAIFKNNFPVELNPKNIAFLESEYENYMIERCKNKAKYLTIKAGEFFSKGISSATKNIKNINPQKIIKVAAMGALATLTTTVGLDYLKNQKNNDKANDKAKAKEVAIKTTPTKKLSKKETIREHNQKVYEDSKEEIAILSAFFENFAQTPYFDNKKNLTIAFGATTIPGKNNVYRPVKKSDVISIEKARKIKYQSIENDYLKTLLNSVNVKMSKKELVVGTILLYTLGGSNANKRMFIQKINQGASLDEKCNALSIYRADKGMPKKCYALALYLKDLISIEDILNARAEGCYTYEGYKDIFAHDNKGNIIKRDDKTASFLFDDASVQKFIKTTKAYRESPKIKNSKGTYECLFVKDLIPKEDIKVALKKDNKTFDASHLFAHNSKSR